MYMDTATTVHKELNTLMDDDGHICKQGPRMLMEVYMESSTEAVTYFKGMLKIEMETENQRSWFNRLFRNATTSQRISTTKELASLFVYVPDQKLESGNIVETESNEEVVENDADETCELTDGKLLELSLKFDEIKLRNVLMIHLGMEENKIQTHLNNYPQNINTAAYHCLREWRQDYQDDKKAYRDMCAALEKAELKRFIKAMQ